MRVLPTQLLARATYQTRRMYVYVYQCTKLRIQDTNGLRTYVVAQLLAYQSRIRLRLILHLTSFGNSLSDSSTSLRTLKLSSTLQIFLFTIGVPILPGSILLFPISLDTRTILCSLPGSLYTQCSRSSRGSSICSSSTLRQFQRRYFQDFLLQFTEMPY